MAKKTAQKQVAQQIQQPVKGLTERFREYIVREAELWYDCAVTAYEIYVQEEWKRQGYASCRDYVEAEFSDLGISYRVFMYRVKMGEAIHHFKIERSDVASIGWTKFKDIASLLLDDNYPLTEKNPKELLEEAKTLSSRDLQRVIREKKAIYKEEVVAKSLKLTFSLLNEYGEIVEEALKKAKEISGYDDDNMALVFICMDYLTNHITDSKAVRKIKEGLEALVREKQ